MEVKCNFDIHEDNYRSWNHPYTCAVLEITKTGLGKEIVFEGLHESGKTKEDTEWLYVEGKAIPFVPVKLIETFPKMKFLSLRRCGIEKVTREDFKGLEHLEHLSMGDNILTSLPEDLFANMTKLRWVYFNNNKIEKMSSKMLLPVRKSLEYVGLMNNARINEYFDMEEEEYADFEKLLQKIDEKCLPVQPQAERAFAEFAKFKMSGDYSDLTINLRGKEFKIHKIVLAAQSSVFQKLFAGEIGEKENPFGQVKNISEGSLEAFFDYFYTGKVEKSIDALEMLSLAIEFDVSELKTICQSRVLTSLNKENVLEAFNLASRHQMYELQRKSFAEIKILFPDVANFTINKAQAINDIINMTRKIEAIKLESAKREKQFCLSENGKNKS